MALGDPIVLKVEKNQNITIQSDGKVMVGVHDIGMRIGRDDSLQIIGAGAGSRLEIDSKFSPQITLNTSEPLIIQGSFTLDAQSKQSALVDVTPVELTSMSGVTSRRTTSNPDKSAASTQPKVTRYDLSTPDNKLSEHSKTGAKTLTMIGDNKRQIVVERGARVDFINTRDDDRQLFTLIGNENMETIENRFRIARGEALADVQRTLDINSPLSAGQLMREKEKYGIPDAQMQGVVDFKNPGRVDLSVPAVLPYGIESASNSPTTGAKTSSVQPAESNMADDTPERKLAARNKILHFSRKYTGYTKLMNGDYDGDAKGGKDLKTMFDNLHTQATNMLSGDGKDVSKPQLAELHKELAKLENTVDSMTTDTVSRLKQTKSIPAGTENNPDKWKKDNVPGWLYDRLQEMKKDVVDIQGMLGKTPSLSRKAAFTGKVGALNVSRDNVKFDGLVNPDNMPKLAVADTTSLPTSVETAIPDIVKFLKGRSGGQGAA